VTLAEQVGHAAADQECLAVVVDRSTQAEPDLVAIDPDTFDIQPILGQEIPAEKSPCRSRVPQQVGHPIGGLNGTRGLCARQGFAVGIGGPALIVDADAGQEEGRHPKLPAVARAAV
jgi:hypothetical protein